jgi:hypothetical protein
MTWLPPTIIVPLLYPLDGPPAILGTPYGLSLGTFLSEVNNLTLKPYTSVNVWTDADTLPWVGSMTLSLSLKKL